MWKWLNGLSVAARLLITVGVTIASVVIGVFVALWIADFDDRVGSLETQEEVARAERARFAEESRRRDEESRQRDEEILAVVREGQDDAEETNNLVRNIVPVVEASNAETKLYVAEEISGVKATIEVHGLEIENLKDTEAVPASAAP